MRRLFPWALLVVLPFLLGAGDGSGLPRIPGVSTRFGGRDVRVWATLSPGLPASVAQRLASGLPTTTTWEIRLFHFRNVWPNSLKDERRYAVTATYRPETADFLVERRLDDRLLESRTVASKAEATRALSELPDVPSFTMGKHLLGKKLVVRVRCVYGSAVSLGVVPTTEETDWTRSGIFEWREGGEAGGPETP